MSVRPIAETVERRVLDKIYRTAASEPVKASATGYDTTTTASSSHRLPRHRLIFVVLVTSIVTTLAIVTNLRISFGHIRIVMVAVALEGATYNTKSTTGFTCTFERRIGL